MMSRAYTMFAAALLVLGLGGCSGGATPIGGGAAANRSDGSGSFDATSDRGGAGLEDVVEEARPQAGGVTAMPTEHGDEVSYRVEGGVEPVCRLRSGDTQYRFHGSVFRKIKGVDGEFTVTDTCSTSSLTVRFWNGHSCESREVTVQDCKFNGLIASNQMDVYNLYSGSINHKVTLTPEMGPVSQTDDSSDASSNPTTSIDSSKLSHPVFKDLVDFQPACQIENVLPVENQLVNAALPDDLPECGFNGRIPRSHFNGDF